ncbi:MAG TPA: hypothetical protein VNJ07_02980 [Chitinophagales bacterium]|nr:hypothetical protein [Chitinophagales bacterium]
MLLIADSGSTKTRWEFVQNGKSFTAYTSGINPFYKNTEQIITDLKKELLPQTTLKPDKIFFYGAGVSQPDKVETVRNALLAVFPAAEAEVEHDLLAAARATCGNSPGIACILGTGSNSCLYDGAKIIDNVPSLGFILGDEGSGGYFGRKLLQVYYYREIPDDLKKSLEEKYDMKKDKVLNSIYTSPTPNQVVAAYADFVTANNKHPFIRAMLHDGFLDFFRRQPSKYPDFKNLPIHFIGSIAFLNQEILNGVMDELKLIKGVILKNPMEGLVKYHCRK